MRLFAAFILPIIALTIACTGIVTPSSPSQTAQSPDLEATIRAVLADSQSSAQGEAPSGDTEATITARVQATVQALMSATPVPSPTPTGAVKATTPPTIAPTPQPSPTPAVPATPTRTPTNTPTLDPTPSPAPVPGCLAAPDGTQVTAWVDEEEVSSTSVNGGRYTLFVDPGDGAILAGKILTFKIGGQHADQSAVLEIGGASVLDLTTPAALGLTQSLGSSGFSLGDSSLGVLAQMLPPHVFVGRASVGC